jgi:hypothetical protein
MLTPEIFYESWPISQITYLKEQGDQIIISCLFFEFIHLLGARLSKSTSHYTKLTQAQQTNWCIHIVSMSFSLIILVANIPLFSIKELASDKLFGTDLYARKVISFSAGFFLWDVLVSFYHFEIQGLAFMFHSLACFFVFFLSLNPFAQYYACYFLLFESSTIFLNIHWFCDKTGQVGTILQWINGIVLLSVFFFARLVLGTYHMGDFIITGFPMRDQSPNLYYLYSTAAVGLGSLNFYWFYLMVKSVASRFVDGKKKVQ